MPQRALIERRPWLLGSIACAMAYYLLGDSSLGGVYLMGLKGAAIGCLAVYALLRHPGADARLLGTSLAFVALAVVLIDLDPAWALSLFFGSHLAALALFLRNRRHNATGSQKGAAVAMLVFVPVIVWAISRGMPGVGAIFLHALVLGGMTASAWLSRFPRYRVGAGAVLAAFAQILAVGAFSDEALGQAALWLAWPAYYIGQFLITTGVVQRLRHAPA